MKSVEMREGGYERGYHEKLCCDRVCGHLELLIHCFHFLGHCRNAASVHAYL